MQAQFALRSSGRQSVSTVDTETDGSMKKRTLMDAEPGKTYIIKEINTDDDDMNAFLFRLGCYAGEPITLISKKKKSCIVVIKDGRYNLDVLLSEAIVV